MLGPTLGMFSEARSLKSSTRRALRISFTRFSADLFWNPSMPSRSATVMSKRSATRRMPRSRTSLRSVGSPRRSTPKLRSAARSRCSSVSGHAGDGQTSSGPRRSSALPQDGHFSISALRRSVPGLRPEMYGITSPARSTVTVSPIRMSMSMMFWALCRLARLIVIPESSTGSRCATGVRLFLPKLHSTSSRVVSHERLVNLYAISPRGWCAVLPSESRYAASASFTTMPSCG